MTQSMRPSFALSNQSSPSTEPQCAPGSWIQALIKFILSVWQSILSHLCSIKLTGLLSFLKYLLIPNFSVPSKAMNMSDDDIDSMEKIFGTNRGGDRYLGQFSVSDLTELIKSSPINSKFQKLGLEDWYIELDLSDCFSHYAYIRLRSLPQKDQYIAFLILHVGDYHFPQKIEKHIPINVNLLYIRWFSLQNPRASFSNERKPFPAQKYPGTGCGRFSFKLLVEQAKKYGRDGIVNVPEHFHNAYLYEGFFFADPEAQGHFQRMLKDLKPDIENKGLAMVSWAIYLGFLRCDGAETRWVSSEQVFPISWKMWAYFLTPFYSLRSSSAERKCGHFNIKWEDAENFCLSTIIQSRTSS